jgi:hypothetical protein
LLLDVNYYPITNFTQCKILGSKDKEYSINIQIKPLNMQNVSNDENNTDIFKFLPDNEDDILDISCTCMDFQMRKLTCKHIYWFCNFSLRNMNPAYCKTSNLYDFLYYYLRLSKQNKGRNEECPICLEHIDYDNENYICCQNSCKNAVHNICWSRYKYISNSDKCVLCRNPI